ncbi:MAG: hypothetical protein ACOX0X_00025 [Candidatus Dojkabacteria bacterium]
MVRGGEDFFKDKNDDFSSGPKRSLRDFAVEKVGSIEKIFLAVLGRKPSSRENAYYRYAAIEELDIYKKLLQSDEHKKILEDASLLVGCKNKVRDLEIIERKLLQKVADLEGEIDQSGVLLKEKNNIISELREQIKNPYSSPEVSAKFEEGFDVYSTARYVEVVEKERPSVKEILKDLLSNLFK